MLKLSAPKKRIMKKKADKLKGRARRAGAWLDAAEMTELQKKILMIISEGVIITGPDRNIVYVSDRAAGIIGGPSDDFTGVDFASLAVKSEAKAISAFFDAVKKEGYTYGHSAILVNTSGKKVRVRLGGSKTGRKTGKHGLYVITLRDMSGKKGDICRIEESERLFRSLIDTAPDTVLLTDLAGRVIYASDNAVELFGYAMLEEVIGKSIFEFVQASCNEKASKDLAEASGGSVVKKREYVIRRGDGDITTGEVNLSPINGESGGIRALMYVIRDITDKKNAEAEIRAGYMTMQKIVDGIITAMEKLVEKKDMYTVGHQRRTAELARAIAVEMGIPADQANGIYISGLIHDVGKIFISTTILNKPGALTEEEYAVIKRHPQAGYDVLKSIEFPWPIADIIIQHHERLDGSGYPYGLKKNEIFLESRILSVADVVEAITFERPYRKACGIDEALNEIISKRGVFYDPEITDVCIKLFREKGFSWGKNKD